MPIHMCSFLPKVPAGFEVSLSIFFLLKSDKKMYLMRYWRIWVLGRGYGFYSLPYPASQLLERMADPAENLELQRENSSLEVWVSFKIFDPWVWGSRGLAVLFLLDSL